MFAETNLSQYIEFVRYFEFQRIISTARFKPMTSKFLEHVWESQLANDFLILNLQASSAESDSNQNIPYLFGYKTGFSLSRMSTKIIKSVLFNFAVIQVLPFLNNPKHLDPSYKLDLDFWDCFGRKKTSYKRRNMVITKVKFKPSSGFQVQKLI